MKQQDESEIYDEYFKYVQKTGRHEGWRGWQYHRIDDSNTQHK